MLNIHDFLNQYVLNTQTGLSHLVWMNAGLTLRRISASVVMENWLPTKYETGLNLSLDLPYRSAFPLTRFLQCLVLTTKSPMQ